MERVVPVCVKHLDPPAYDAPVAHLKYFALHLLALFGILTYAFVVFATLLFVGIVATLLVRSTTEDARTGLSGPSDAFDIVVIVLGIWSVFLMYRGAMVVNEAVWTPLSDWWYKRRAATGTDGADSKEWRRHRHEDPRTYPLDS